MNQCYPNELRLHRGKFSGMARCMEHIHHSLQSYYSDMFVHKRHCLSINALGNFVRMLHHTHTFHLDSVPISSWLDCIFASADTHACKHLHRKSYGMLSSPFLLVRCIRRHRIYDNNRVGLDRSNGLVHIAVSN